VVQEASEKGKQMSLYEEKESYAASRSAGIGGTDCAAILGLSPWKKPIDIYAGKVKPGSLPELDKECLRWGNLLEPIVRQEYAARFGVEVSDPHALRAHFDNYRDWNGNTLVVGKEPWMLGAPDGWMPSVKSGLEVKTASRRSDEWGEEGSDEVPAHYFVQASWYMAVCEAQGWNFATLFSGNKLEQFRLTRDLDFERDMIEACRAFWFDNVLKQVEPAIDESESYGRYLARKFSLGTENVITEPGPDILEWTAKLKLAADKTKEAEEEEQLAEESFGPR
jgi:putative phage-type endonuclease